MDSILDAIEDFRAGKPLIVVDDAGRENEGDLVVAARHATPETVNFMAAFGRGLICVAMEEARLAELGIGQTERANGDPHGTAFAVSVDHAATGTGISASDRSLTIRSLAEANAAPADFRRPGHVFPLAARAGGVLARRGPTEAAVDLSRLAFPDEKDAPHAGAICEIMNDDGTMARLPDLERFAARHGIRIVSVEALADYRASRAERAASARLPTRYGEFSLRGYRDPATGAEHVALTMGDVADGSAILCRVHSECLTGDALGSIRCDCGEQFDRAMRAIAHEGRGALVYLRQEGRGIGLLNKIRAYALQDSGADTVDANLALGFRADERDYRIAAGILADLGIGTVRLMTNNPDKVERLESLGVRVVERVPIVVPPNRENDFYLKTKERRMRHRLGR